MINSLTKLGIPAILLAYAASCLNSGCTLRTKDNAEWQLTFGSQIGISSKSSETKSCAEVTTEFPSLEALIFDSTKAKEENKNEPKGETP